MTANDHVVVNGIRWTLTPSGQEILSPEELELDSHIKAGRHTVIKHGAHRSVYRVALARETVYWKHCRLDGWRAWWRDLLRGPKAKLEFDRALELARRGIATIEPLAWGRFDRVLPAGSFLITRALEGTIPLDISLEQNPAIEPRERWALTRALAAFVVRLHDAGVIHPDLHPGNLLARHDVEGSKFFLIDVHDTEIGPPASRI